MKEEYRDIIWLILISLAWFAAAGLVGVAISSSQIKILIHAMLNPANLFFSALIGLIFGLGIILAINKKAKNFSLILPSFAVSVGVFGTFWGIFIGLSGFDTANISASISLLLEGMKTAFVTSIIGMGASIILKFLYAVLDSKEETQNVDPVACLANIENNTAEIAVNQLEAKQLFLSLDEINKQIKEQHSDLTKHHYESMLQLKEFTSNFPQETVKVIATELKRLINNFNATLSEQAGQAFADWKKTAEQMVKWQTEYKNTIEATNANTLKTLDKITELGEKYADIQARFKEWQAQLAKIDSTFHNIALSGNELAERAKELSNQNELLQTSINAIRDAGEKAADVTPNVAAKLVIIVKEVEQLQEQMNKLIKMTSVGIYKNIQEMGNLSQKYIENMETTLQKELKESLDSFASVMMSLSSKFAEDYTPLTEKLKEVLTIAQGRTK